MRTGITIRLSESDRRRLKALVSDGNTPQKHVWRARIVLMSADGIGTSAIMAETGTAKTTVWRWQARFMEEGVEGLLRDKTRPPGKAPILTRRRLKNGVFRPLVNLQATINRFIAEHNQTPKPFVWRANPNAIIAARNRGFQALESIH